MGDPTNVSNVRANEAVPGGTGVTPDGDTMHFYGQYLRFLADALALRDWTVLLECGPLEVPARAAEVGRVYGRKFASVRVPESFFDTSIEDQRQALTHELLHCHLAGAQDDGQILSNVLPRKAFAAWHPRFEHNLEQAVDALADVLAPTLPLPITHTIGGEEP